jgi:hypothetical protein
MNSIKNRRTSILSSLSFEKIAHKVAIKYCCVLSPKRFLDLLCGFGWLLLWDILRIFLGWLAVRDKIRKIQQYFRGSIA